VRGAPGCVRGREGMVGQGWASCSGGGAGHHRRAPSSPRPAHLAVRAQGQGDLHAKRAPQLHGVPGNVGEGEKSGLVASRLFFSLARAARGQKRRQAEKGGARLSPPPTSHQRSARAKEVQQGSTHACGGRGRRVGWVSGPGAGAREAQRNARREAHSSLTSRVGTAGATDTSRRLMLGRSWGSPGGGPPSMVGEGGGVCGWGVGTREGTRREAASSFVSVSGRAGGGASEGNRLHSFFLFRTRGTRLPWPSRFSLTHSTQIKVRLLVHTLG